MGRDSKAPHYHVTPESLRIQSTILDVPLREDEIDHLAAYLNSFLSDARRLWEVDVDDVEMAIVFRVDNDR